MTSPLPPSPGPLRAAFKRGAFAAMRWLGLNGLARSVHRRALPILCYHNIVAEPPVPWIAAGGLHLPVARFRRQMEHVASRWSPLGIEAAVAALASDSLPRDAVVITFDDGYAGNLELAAPILERLGVPATIFLATDYIDQGGWYWWDELPALLTAGLGRRIDAGGWVLDLQDSAGVRAALGAGAERLRAAPLEKRSEIFDALALATGAPRTPVPASQRPMTWNEAAAAPAVLSFGGHSASHRVLDLLGQAEVQDDSRRCRAALDARLPGRTVSAFCYPEGRVGAGVPAQLRAAGFTSAVTASSEPSRERLAAPADDPMLLPRIGVSAAMSFDAFVAGLAGTRQLLGGPPRAAAT